jgi:hypothetical protein
MSVHRPEHEVFWLAMITRNFYLTLLISACILLVGGFLFRHSEAGSFATAFLSFAVGFTLLQVLDDRDRRPKKSDD